MGHSSNWVKVPLLPNFVLLTDSVGGKLPLPVTDNKVQSKSF